MMTFLPSPDFKRCARIIDNKRLWKQILEADGIIRILEGKVNKKLYLYKNHPCVRMWRNHLDTLYFYRDTFVQEWLNRRLIRPPYLEDLDIFFDGRDGYRRGKSAIRKPRWLNEKKLHSSHRAALLFKNPEWYSQFGWKEKPKIEYFWPKNKD